MLRESASDLIMVIRSTSILGGIMWRRILIPFAVLAVPLSLVVGPAVQAADAQGSSTATITPASGAAGSTVTGSGANWTPGDHIQAEWGDDYSNLGSPVVVASDGTFQDSFAIPTNATQGSHQVLFWDQEGRYFEVANFDVTSGSAPSPTCPPKPNPSVSFSKTSGPIGTQFSAAGSGWYANDTVAIHLPYGSKGLFGLTRITWPADSSGDWQVNITVEKPTPPGTYELIFSQSACGGLTVNLNFTVTAPPPSTLPNLFTDKHLPACILSMTELAAALVGATEAAGAIHAWEGALTLLDATGKLGDFLDQLRTNKYWASLINAGIIDPLNDCLIGVQLLLQDTSGQAAIAVAQWMKKNLHA
jgi:hypothetical protein